MIRHWDRTVKRVDGFRHEHGAYQSEAFIGHGVGTPCVDIQPYDQPLRLWFQMLITTHTNRRYRCKMQPHSHMHEQGTVLGIGDFEGKGFESHSTTKECHTARTSVC